MDKGGEKQLLMKFQLKTSQSVRYHHFKLENFLSIDFLDRMLHRLSSSALWLGQNCSSTSSMCEFNVNYLLALIVINELGFPHFLREFSKEIEVS